MPSWHQFATRSAFVTWMRAGQFCLSRWTTANCRYLAPTTSGGRPIARAAPPSVSSTLSSPLLSLPLPLPLPPPLPTPRRPPLRRGPRRRLSSIGPLPPTRISPDRKSDTTWAPAYHCPIQSISIKPHFHRFSVAVFLSLPCSVLIDFNESVKLILWEMVPSNLALETNR